MNGILLINKPIGWTSFDVVNKVRNLIQKSEYNVTKKKRFPVGHAGTLDPLATGLLVVLVGNYTKKSSNFIKLDKKYHVFMKLGLESTTGDEEGIKEIISERKPSIEEITLTLDKFVGEIYQTPPAYSAIKINGKKAYELARKGKEVKLEPRKVNIYNVEVINYEYPIVEFNTEVSSGTYIRSLVEDIGKSLGTGAYMSELSRTKIGDFELSNSISMDVLNIEKIKNSIITFD